MRYTYEGWYDEVRPRQGSDQAIRDYLREEEKYYSALLPEALDLMKGMADGAKNDLDQSRHSEAMSNFEKILMINSYYELLLHAPACSGAVILGTATKDGKTIHVSSEDQHFFPQEYLVTFIASPSDPHAHRITVTDTAGEIGSEHAMNDRGVTVSGYAGGFARIAEPTPASPFSGYRRPGLDWQVGDFYAAAFGGSAKDAVQLLTVGRPDYRAKSGKKIVIGKCARGVNWLVSDAKEAYVVESIPADENGVARYAIRKPGDLSEKNASFIVSTNNVEANYSCDENNDCNQSHPMSLHGHFSLPPTPHFELNTEGMRFWTLTWLIRNNYGEITPEMVKVWRTAHFIYDEAGVKHENISIDGKTVPANLVPDAATLCWHSSGPPGVETNKGVDTYVSISTPDDLTVARTRGRPCEWVGPWDTITLRP